MCGMEQAADEAAFFIAVANDEATEKFNLENNSMHTAAGGCGVGAAGGSAPRRKPGTELQLKAQMRWLVGNGHPGKLKELEERVERHEQFVNRVGGISACLATVITLVHVGMDYLKVHGR